MTHSHSSISGKSTSSTSASGLSELARIPAFSLPLQGRFLVEASAGTGKTWTLSNLIIRLLVEHPYSPQQILATTFTRAAAQELADRIRSDLEKNAHFFAQPDEMLREGMLTAEPLQQYLLQGMGQSAAGRRRICDRLELALLEFDDLYVGTLDSLCQKLLREFAVESGAQSGLKIGQDDKTVLHDLIHDNLRAWRQAQHDRYPQIIHWLLMTGRLTDVEHHARHVEAMLNFPRSRLPDIQLKEPDWDAISQRVQQLAQQDHETLLAVFLTEGEPNPHHFYSKRRFANYGKSFAVLINSLQKINGLALIDKDSDSYKLWGGFNTLDNQFSGKTNANARQLIEQHPTTSLLAVLYRDREAIEEYLENLKRWLTQYLARQVHEQLPARLAAQGMTTFSQQMRTLAELLARQPQLAQDIRQRYPVALIDEFQDTNHDQLAVIKAIYLNSERLDQALYLVGDPKQAIYGFRGGDVQTYQQVRQMLLEDGETPDASVVSLNANQRSVAPLVQAVNNLFERATDLGEGIAYQSVSAGQRPHAQLVDESGQPVQPLTLALLPAGQDALTACAIDIARMLRQPHFLRTPDGQQRRLVASDIAVLTHGHWELGRLHQLLDEQGIPAQRQARYSIFNDVMAEWLLRQLQAWLNPHREHILRRLLLTPLYGWTITELDDPARQSEREMLQQQLEQQARWWQEAGIMAACHHLESRQDILTRLAAQADGARHLSDYRQLLELLHQAEQRGRSSSELCLWLQQQIQSPDDQDERQQQQPLPASESVWLMTIFASKGLEFPVVYCPTLHRNRKHYTDVLYGLDEQQERIVAAQGDEQLHQQHRARQQAEDQRLAYVAMTRAAQALTVYLIQEASCSESQRRGALWHWLLDPAEPQKNELNHLDNGNPAQQATGNQDGSRKIIVEPATLADGVTISPWQEASENLSDPAAESRMADRSQTLGLRQPLQRPLFGWFTTSFTSLNNRNKGLATPESATAILDDIPDNELLADPEPVADDYLPVRFRFARGAEAGTLLHALLENLREDNTEHWETIINDLLTRHATLQHDGAITARNLMPWLNEILDAHLPQEGCLRSLNASNKQAEMRFDLRLQRAATPSRQLISCFNESPFIQLDEQLDIAAARYLTGAIDLVYQHEGKFYIADYKSNFLGSQLEDYSQQAIESNMQQEGYFFQAALYLIALHRFLAVRQPDYQPARHLGGAVYLYLRGMQAGQAAGIYHWQPDPDWIVRLDKLMGGKH